VGNGTSGVVTSEHLDHRRADASVGEIAAGDSDREIFVAIFPSLRRYAASCAGSEIDADDLVQEGLERTLRRHRLADLDHPEAYLRRAIFSSASNARRSLSRQRGVRRRAGVADDEAPHFPSDLSELRRLSIKDRTAVYLVDVEGATFAELAAVLGCSEAAARQRTVRARKRLRGQIESDDREATR